MAESQVAGILPQSSLKASDHTHIVVRVSRQLSSVDLLLQLFLLCLMLSFAFSKCKKRNHRIKNCVILDHLIDFDFVHKHFPKAANWQSSCVMLQNASNCLANTGTIPVGIRAWCSVWMFFPKVAITWTTPPRKPKEQCVLMLEGPEGFTGFSLCFLSR